MTKTLLKLAVVLVIGLLTYNFFFGSPEEKATSRRVAGEVRDLGASVLDLLTSEKQKLDEGKYDEALGTLKRAIGMQQEQADALVQDDHHCGEHCAELREMHAKIEQDWQTIATSTVMAESEKTRALDGIRQRILELTRKAEELATELNH